ncbi:hypothetical protein ACFU99_15280 [Streptomyces sp. NPDC057654]|uniref:hypothetical protein n=1 Tax=Streptomyces sp. NPDC057654 TaxID=3346196 RepID=UPI0036C4E886
MPSFEELRHLRLGKLEEAVDDWTAMVKKLKTLEEVADKRMAAKTKKADWQGENAAAVKPFVLKTAKEFSDALTEATSIRNILKEAHAKFQTCQNDLQAAVDEATGNELSISSSGVVRSVKVTPPFVAQPQNDDVLNFMKAPAAEQKKIDAVVAKINKILEAAADADETTSRALRTIAGKDPHNFTTVKYGSYKDAEKAQAIADAKTATRIANHLAEDGTAKNLDELKQLQKLFDRNAKNPDFSTTFYKTMGPKGALNFYANVALDASSLHDKTRINLVHHIQNEMGSMLGVATSKHSSTHLDATWITGLQKAGHQQLDLSRVTTLGTEVYGYQALGALVRDGKFDAGFMTTIGRDMVAMERKDPRIWDRNAPAGSHYGSSGQPTLNFDKTGGKGFHPLTGLMEGLSHNPEAATAFFNEPVREDSNHDGIITSADKVVTHYDSNYDGKINKEDTRPMSMVDYMLDRNPDADALDYVKGRESRSGQTALGSALEAATTHRDPSDDGAHQVRHTAAMAKVMERVVEKVGAHPVLVEGKDPDHPGVLSGLAGNFGNMAAEYMPDMQMTLENENHLIKPFGHGAKFTSADLQQFLGAVGQDPDAYGSISNAQQAYTTALVHDVVKHRDQYDNLGDPIHNAVYPGGQIAGIMTEARTEAIHGDQAYKDAQFNKAIEEKSKWIDRTIDSVGGKYIDKLPLGAGDAVGWLKEDITSAMVDRMQQDKTSEAQHDAAITYREAEEATKKSAAAAVRTACRGSGISEQNIDALAGVASTSAVTAHTAGRGARASATGAP